MPAAPQPTATPVVSLDGVTVIYGKNHALKNVSATFARGAVGLLGPNGAGKSTMLKALLGFVEPNEGRMTVLGMNVARAPLAIRARIGYMPESDAHIPGMNAVSFVAYCGQLAGLPAVDAMQRAHEVLYYVGLGEARYRNVETYSTGHEAAHQARAGARPRSRSAVPRRADQRHGPEGARRDARARARSRPQQGRQPDPLVAPPARRRVHLRPRRRDGQGAGRDAGADPGAQGPAGRVYELRIKGDLRGFLDVLAAGGMEVHSTDEDVMRVFVPADAGGDQRAIFNAAASFGVQVRHLRPSVPTLEDVFAKAIGEE